jgi:hypothetical protein
MSTNLDVSRYLCTVIVKKAQPATARWPAGWPEQLCSGPCMPPPDDSLPPRCGRHGGRDVRVMYASEIKSTPMLTDAERKVLLANPHFLGKNQYSGKMNIRLWLAPIVLEIEQERAQS